MVADLLGGPLDHAVALAGLLVFHLAGAGNLEALFGARFGLQLGHLALLIGQRGKARPEMARRDKPLKRVLGIELNRRHGSPNRPGSEKAALWQRPRSLATAGRPAEVAPLSAAPAS